MKKMFCATLAALLMLAGCNGKHDTIEPSQSSMEESSEVSISSEETNTQTITIPEGYTLARIGLLLEDKGVCTAEEFISAASSGDFSDYPLIAGQPTEQGRCFALEGYLFPDTYEVYRDESPDTIIRRMLENTEQRINENLRAKMEASGHTVDEIITMASIIEKEAVQPDQMTTISSVLYNRLGSGMKLQNDVTATYVQGVIKQYVMDEEDYSGLYNTYQRDGLPAGPICNPGLAAIRAALEPANSNYLYYVADANRNAYFAVSSEEHQENMKLVRAAEKDMLPPMINLTIPEGYTLPRIGMLLEEKEVCTAEEFIAEAQTGDFSDYPLVAEQKADLNRCFKLEGYLFPDTYEIYQDESPNTIIRRILQNTERRIDDELRAKIKQSGYTTDQIITLASIIEKEAYGHEHMPKISSVLQNRLNSGMRLQCDVTITYVEGAIKNFITGDLNRYNSYYNTYKCDKLPAGAICNPGLSAIKAALEPEKTDYLYFITDTEKNFYYAVTWVEHQQNIDLANVKSGEQQSQKSK